MPQKSERWFQIHHLMKHMPLRSALHWCEPGASGCGCLGCANNSGGLARAGITREEWKAYMTEQFAYFVGDTGAE